MASPAKRCRTDDHAKLSALENLPPFLFAKILWMAGPRAAAALACASTTLRYAASAEAHWRRFCADDIGLDAPLDPEDRPLPFFKVAYKSWVRSFHSYPLPLVKRVKSFWSSMKSWLSENYLDALDTLADGLAETEIRRAEYDLGCELPLPTKLLYRFCDGQIWNKDIASYGIIGGYEFDRYMVNVHFLPLKDAVRTAKSLWGNHRILGTSKYIVVARSPYQKKTFLLDPLSGQLYVGTNNLKSCGEKMPCVPYSLIRLHVDGNNDMPQDGLLLWLEEHLRRLQGGFLNVQQYTLQSNGRHISLYPKAPASCSSAVTHGIKVRASAIFVPEVSAPRDDPRKYVYYYCIHLSLSEPCVVNGKSYSSCRFESSHLIIRTGNNVFHVDEACALGDLKQGVDDLAYGCYILPSMVPASIEGSLTFVPLRNHQPEGDEFAVKIASFLLELPDYIF